MLVECPVLFSKNFNAVELVGLREMMLHRQYDKIDQYEQEWRKKHGIKDGEPSTLVQKKISKKIMAPESKTVVKSLVSQTIN